MFELPSHLQKYKVEQNYSRYTPLDQATWRYILRQLKDFLSKNAHSCYLDGLEKTGITEEEIPRIETISEKLQKFGWTAIPVSGFIPPAAFMELQSLSVLPIASDMRSIDHLLYTPAPDIVHEAAGHAPILIEPEYASYLKEYAQVAKKAIISKEDLDLYEAIRELSDIKENPQSTPEQIIQAEQKLQTTIKSTTHVSEATELSRMNWWTAEYGLIGDIQNPKIFGAGLLSSVGESKWCLSSQVKKIPISVNCIKQSYDITEPQPQLFVTPDFKTLVSVLHEMSSQMAYKVGGTLGLDKAILAKSVNTIETDTGFQISGVVSEYLKDSNGHPIFIKIKGPTQISMGDKQLPGHGKEHHLSGYSFPMGKFDTDQTLIPGSLVTLTYESGVVVRGMVKLITEYTYDTKISQILTLEQVTVAYKQQVLFQPDWGVYDICVSTKIISVFGGPADRKNYGETDDFVAMQVPIPFYSKGQKTLFQVFQNIRDYRRSHNSSVADFNMLLRDSINKAPEHWLVILELLELAIKIKASDELQNKLKNQLEMIKQKNEKLTSIIDDGLRLAYA
ncbi:MAG: aromatic amino acid hydroxylase [Pseudobdellovibrio sp.]